MLFSVQFSRATQTAFYLLADAYGFQQLNFSARTKEWVPATAGLAADNLVSLLRDASVRRCATCSSQMKMDEAWREGIADVHAEYFEEYKLWARQLELDDPPLITGVTHDSRPVQLMELALQFLIYTEAANLRHTPRLLFLIYFIMRSSSPFLQALRLYLRCRPATDEAPGRPQGNPYHHTHWLYWLSLPADCFPGKPNGHDLTSLRRNLLHQLYLASPAALLYPDPSAPLPEQLTPEQLCQSAQQQEQALDDATTGILAVTQAEHRELVQDVLMQLRGTFQHGSQQVFLNTVVQPLFFFLAEQIDLAGQQGLEEAALRIAYCDVDEACCSPQRVKHQVLQQLKNTFAQLPDGSKDYWTALKKVVQPSAGWVAGLQRATGQATSATGGLDRYPRDAQRVQVLENLALLMQRNREPGQQEGNREDRRKELTAKFNPALTLESESLAVVYARATHGADWWATHLFKSKTFVEARSAAAPFVAFWRVYTFHAVLFTAMAAVAFVWQLKAAGAAGWFQLLAAVCLATVTDGCMRSALAAAHLLLLTYNWPVKRHQAGQGSRMLTINPFPPGTWRRAAPHLLKLPLWLVWTAVLAICVVPALLQKPVPFLGGLSPILYDKHLWLVLPLLHMVFFWGGSVLRQRTGYVTSWQGMASDVWSVLKRSRAPAKAKRSAHANCAADADIDALFYASSNLAVDKQRSLINLGVWLAVIAVKVVFEFGLVLLPVAKVVLAIMSDTHDMLGLAMDAESPSDKDSTLKASQSLIIMSMAVPVMLLSLCDTGLLFSLVGGLFSSMVGFKRGLGAIKSWGQLVTRFGVLLENYKRHCVSRSAIMLHLKGADDVDKQQLCLSAVAAGWNALAVDLRQRDLLSNKELAHLMFEQLQLNEEQLKFIRQHKELQLTTVLPARCFIAGAVPELAAGAVGSDQHMWTAATVWSWFCWLLWQTGLVREDAHCREEWPAQAQAAAPPRTREQQRRWQRLLSEAVKLLRLLSTPPTSPSNTAQAAAAALEGAGASAAGAGCKGLLHTLPSDDKAKAEAWGELRSTMGQLMKDLEQEYEELAATVESHNSTWSKLGRLLWPSSRQPGVNISELRQVVEPAIRSLMQRWAPTEAEETRYRPRLRAPTLDEINKMDIGLGRLYEAGQAAPAVPQVAGWLCDSLTLLQGDSQPADDEAVRFILGFAASLNDPGLSVAPALHVMPSLTTLTPHYDEDIVYALNREDAMHDLQDSQLVPQHPGKMDNEAKMVYLMDDDGCPTTTMAYLRSVYSSSKVQPGQHQWSNFVERIRGVAQQRKIDISQLSGQITEFHFLPSEPLHPLKEELLLWASWRGQLLSRTARGMMSYRTALAAIADYENPHISSTTAAAANLAGPQALRQAVIEDLLDAKYNYVVSSQNLGEFASKTQTDLKAAWLVHSMRLLRGCHPALKIAFIDKQLVVVASRPGHRVELRRDCSVLLSSVHQQQLDEATGMMVRPREQKDMVREYEAYRVQLPINFESTRGVILGEGKPENQNHAIIFCHGETLQTIDCNQDNLVSEGLKLRNLLAEFLPAGWDLPQPRFRGFADRFRGSLNSLVGHRKADAVVPGHLNNERLLKKMRQGKGRVALVGFREWIFSEDSGALAEFAAATERSFGTTVQRLMHFPGACRFHYGHPDVWRRSFVATCGGVSKANKALHVSEDVFGGYNVMLRGRDITYVDYIAVGKGRDMGFETINTFEAKIAAGNGEQVLSREIRRLGQSMDFARLMSWYHTGNGFFINTALTMLSVHASLWVMLLLALAKLNSAAVQEWLWTVQVLQLGSLSVVVYWVTLALEAGLFESVWVILRQMLQGSLMFYIFRAQTSASSFTQDLLFGGAKYLPTGRGYKLAHTSFRDLWRRFGRSHMYFGAVLLQYCIAVITAGHLKGLQLFVLWAPMLVVVSLLLGPFWFTPFAFRTTNIVDDMADMQHWRTSPSLTDSWSAWTKEWTDMASDAAGKQMGRFAACVRAHLMKLPTLLLVLGAVSRIDTRKDTKLPAYAISIILAGGTLLMVWAISASKSWSARKAMRHQLPRLVNMAATVVLVGGLALSGFATSGNVWEFGNAALAMFGTVLLLRMLPLVYYNPLLRHLGGAGICRTVYYVADGFLEFVLNSMRFVLSMFDILTGLQAQLLFNSAYAQQVMADASMQHSEVPKLITEALKLKRQQQQQKRRSPQG